MGVAWGPIFSRSVFFFLFDFYRHISLEIYLGIRGIR